MLENSPAHLTPQLPFSKWVISVPGDTEVQEESFSPLATLLRGQERDPGLGARTSSSYLLESRGIP